jgi:hypothetical protein
MRASAHLDRLGRRSDALADSGPQGAFFWIEIDGSGSCDGTLVEGFAFWETVSSPFGSGAALASATASAGSHRVDVCHAGFDTETTDVVGKVLVEWDPVVSGAGLTEAGVGASVEELLASRAHLLED